MSDLKDIIDICKENGINLYMYISPAHASLDGEGIYSAGLYSSFEDWKRKLSGVASSYNVPLVDFSGYNSITTEKVATPMRYYWDSSHFTEEVGNVILDTIINGKESFGVYLTPDNIEKHLTLNKENRVNYIRQNQDYIDDLHSLYKRALSGERMKNEDFSGMF